MDLHPKLLAAADMCEAGEELNLDEMAFLLRYAADELADRPRATLERDRLLDHLRHRLLARCDLLNRPERDHDTARNGGLEELEALEEALDHDLRTRFRAPDTTDTGDASPAGEVFPADRFISGR